MLASLSVMVLAGAASISVAGQGAQRVATKPAAASEKATATWKPSRTPDGQPDLQGVWAFRGRSAPTPAAAVPSSTSRRV